MCVIVYKPAEYIGSNKDETILLDILEKCSFSNPDLCGFMYQLDNRVIIHKGFDTLDDMMKVLPDSVLLNQEVVFHFRIATHGKVVVDNSHPFPISNNLDDLTAQNVICDRGIAHNGILYGSPTTDYYKGRFSDTLLLIKMVLSSLDETGLDYILKRESGSNKFCVMTGDSISFYGNFTEYKGLTVSNTNFIQKPITVGFTSKIGLQQVCKRCGTPLLAFEKTDGICISCQSANYKLMHPVTCSICENSSDTTLWDIEYSNKQYDMYICPNCEKYMRQSSGYIEVNRDKNQEKTD